MNSTRHIFVTPAPLLQHVTNNYSNLERQFEELGEVFVDVGEDDSPNVPKDERTRKEKLRDALLPRRRRVSL